MAGRFHDIGSVLLLIEARLEIAIPATNLNAASVALGMRAFGEPANIRSIRA